MNDTPRHVVSTGRPAAGALPSDGTRQAEQLHLLGVLDVCATKARTPSAPRHAGGWAARFTRLCRSAGGLLALAILVMSCQTAPPDDEPEDPFGQGDFHIQTQFVRRVATALTTTVFSAGALSGTLEIYAPKPPELASQTLLSCDMLIPAAPDFLWVEVQDESPLLRPLLALDAPVTSNDFLNPLVVELQYEVDLFAQHLSEGTGSSPVVPLSSEQRAAYLASAPRMDFDAAVFSDWILQAGLSRKAGERDLAFGHRVFRYLTSHATYGVGGDYDSRRPSVVCQTLTSDCGGLSLLFVASLRANGVPARTLFGRWALSQTGNYGQYHVIAEFYAGGVGWVPVDVAGVVAHGIANPDTLFGHTDGLFLAFHEDTDIVAAPGFVHGWAQYVLLRWVGEGDFWPANITDWWSVSTE